jgi:hypothetical protein
MATPRLVFKVRFRSKRHRVQGLRCRAGVVGLVLLGRRCWADMAACSMRENGGAVEFLLRIRLNAPLDLVRVSAQYFPLSFCAGKSFACFVFKALRQGRAFLGVARGVHWMRVRE